MSRANVAKGVAAVFAAAALAIPVIAEFEGYVPKAYKDPVGIPTACYGSTAGIEMERTYSDAECARRLADDAATHGLEIAHCLPANLPTEVRAAFTSFAFNVGSNRFCASGVARKANAGDLRGACADLSRWVYAGGRQLSGLVRRRAAERALCERGLA
ncbi:MAG: lysozyme [Phenylobacterium sp.]|uniref:lysozyme n=1 Tax=Phenylobacterium sp. TaxID=1871053 RepID=UPI001A3F6135|nr:lysozyme [Phenylobacterium sp.]MBL8773341.1 lysozyme [Phenylobacterium sp.]